MRARGWIILIIVGFILLSHPQLVTQIINSLTIFINSVTSGINNVNVPSGG